MKDDIDAAIRETSNVAWAKFLREHAERGCPPIPKDLEDFTRNVFNVGFTYGLECREPALFPYSR